ncbi:hypothetical protein GXW83_10210 [Streptacidiphilus sp. PB12-B1b]|uniref:hypothetical protein n=1 Tax=Streptacidiphilus sp. PB12-B1b TaxID=2705012 RepID=UPI0015FCAB0A|nr:hypothetical protein [Streptacidiphilus sp. PB12-B1b]QMU76054.1 hypothetical protein GXW83_10210 [Streptacidiphilus sp. PB12-B1b]
MAAVAGASARPGADPGGGGRHAPGQEPAGTGTAGAGTARDDRGSGAYRRGSWRSGLGCGITLLSVVALVAVGQLAGVLAHRPGRSSSAVVLAARLNALPAARQAVPGTGEGVATLVAGLGLPSSTTVDTQFRPGDTVVAIGVTGDCVFVDVHDRRLDAWPAPELSPCTASVAYRTVLTFRRRAAAEQSADTAASALPHPPA